MRWQCVRIAYALPTLCASIARALQADCSGNAKEKKIDEEDIYTYRGYALGNLDSIYRRVCVCARGI